MKRLLLSTLVFLSVYGTALATNVSGAIMANTTWMKAGSPYIVTDTVVVFPGVTLRIEPGVTVRFDPGTRLEIREASLVALGTATDSIIFTSNSATPAPDDWRSVYISSGKPRRTQYFRYCRFSFAHFGIEGKHGALNDTLRVSHCNFSSNLSGICGDEVPMTAVYIDSSGFVRNGCGLGSYENNPNGTRVMATIGASVFADNLETGAILVGARISGCRFINNKSGLWETGGYSRILNSSFDSNTVHGIYLFQAQGDSIAGCSVQHNGIGIFDNSGLSGGYLKNHFTRNVISNDSIGILLAHDADSIWCNRLCGNKTYAIVYTGQKTFRSGVHGNYFCQPDSASSAAAIFDAYDDPNLGVLHFMPIDSLCPPGASALGIPETRPLRTASVSPNPFGAEAQIRFSTSLKDARVLLLDTRGTIVRELRSVNGTGLRIGREGLPPGLYLLRVQQAGLPDLLEKVLIAD